MGKWLDDEFLRRLELLKLALNRTRTGRRGGETRSNRRGGSIEFVSHRTYSQGDEFRAIDWNLYARLDRLFVKTYKEEIELSVEIIVDAAASMELPSLEKFERAKRLAISLGYVALTDRHYVRFSWVQPGSIAAGPWFHQRGDLMRMVEDADGAIVQGHVPLAEWTVRAAPSLRMRGGQAILITDGMYRPADFFRAVHVLLVRNMELKVIQVISPQELRPGRLLRGGMLVDAETGGTHQLDYRPAELERAVAEHNEQLVRFCKRHGIPFAQHRLDEPFESFVIRTLPTRGFVE